MTVSTTADFNLDLADIVEEAFERASGGLRSLQTGYDFKTARRSLSLLMLEWANRGLNMWTMEQGTLPLLAGTATYTLPADTVDLLEHAVRLGNTDFALSRISVSTYATIPNKTTQARPNQIFINRLRTPTVTLWPVPDQEYTLTYWRLRKLKDAGAAENTEDVPFRFLPALIAGLAFYLAQKIPEGAPQLAALKAEYDEAWRMAAEEDRERASVYLLPGRR